MIFLIILFTLFIFFAIKSCIRPSNFPKGPPLLPFIGSALSLPSNHAESKISQWRKKYGDFIGIKVIQYRLVFICNHDDILNGFKHPNFQGRIHSKTLMQRSFNDSLGFFPGDDDRWLELKRFTVRYLGKNFIPKLESTMLEEIQEDFLKIKTEEINHIDGSFMQIPSNIIVKLLFTSIRDEFKEEIKNLQILNEKAVRHGRMTGIELYYPFFSKFCDNIAQVDAIEASQSFFKKILDQRRKSFNPLEIADYTDAFLSEQIKEKESNGFVRYFSDEEYLSCVLDLFQAGSESTGKTLAYVLLYISLNQRVQDKLHEEIDRVIGRDRVPLIEDKLNLPYVEATLYEAQRMNPLTPVGVPHRVTEDTKFKDYLFPKDTLIYFALKHYLNDPEIWDKPDEFIPERFIENPNLKKKVLNFGLGKRLCIGELIAKNSMFLYIAQFFQKFSIQLPAGYPRPSTSPVLGFTQGPRPFELVIQKR